MPVVKRIIVGLGLLVHAAVVSAAGKPPVASDGVHEFVTGTFGGATMDALEHGALPFKLVQAVLLRKAHEQRGWPLSLKTWPKVMLTFGVTSPKQIIYGDNQVLPWDGSVVGIVRNEAKTFLPPLKVDVSNIGCALCHSGVTYDAQGTPDPSTVRVGAPSSSFNPERYITDVYAAMKAAVQKSDELMALIDQLYPDMGTRERLTLKWGVIPRVRDALEPLAAGIDRPFPFINGSPGLTNGVAALKFRLGFLSGSEWAPEHGFTSIPDLADRRLKSALLYDGVYAPRGRNPFIQMTDKTTNKEHHRQLADIVAFFTVPTMGVHADDVPEQMPKVREAYAATLIDYRPQAFPGVVDRILATRGREIYDRQCASCHGVYEGKDDPGQLRLVSFPNRLSPLAEIGSDEKRANAIDERLVKALKDSKYTSYLQANAHGGYVASILTGVWLTAPYLHNGSVPTLWHLMHPDERPKTFTVGGHRLDFSKVGLRGEVGRDGNYMDSEDYVPWSEPEVYNTRLPGRSNRGHEEQFVQLNEADKTAIIEFLKLL